jgi:aminoglycoside 2'-N-acetyltransferase I
VLWPPAASLMSDISKLTLRSAPTEGLSDLELTELRMLVFLAFDGGFDSDDWEHTLGGQHFLGLLDDAIVAHASLVARELHVGERAVRTGYVEGVAVAAEHRRNGYGNSVMAQLGDFLAPRFELGALSAAEHNQSFYRRLGWRRWQGPTAVMVNDVAQPTPEDDGGVMILETPSTGQLDHEATLACDWRAGDVW